MSYTTYQQKKFLKSLAWNSSMMLLAFGIDYLAKSLGSFNIPDEIVVGLGIVLARISKMINVWVQANKELS